MGQTSEHRENWECFPSGKGSGLFHKHLKSNFSLNSGYCGIGKGKEECTRRPEFWLYTAVALDEPLNTPQSHDKRDPHSEL